jgi:hypothetical protein
MLRPEITEEIEEVGKIFTPGTRFPDYSKPSGTLQAITVYGGGKAKYPKGEQQIAHTITGYPNAVPIGKRTVNDTTKFGPTGHEPFTMTTNFNSSEEALVDGKYTKTLEPGTSIKGLEIAIGARWWDGTAPHQDLNCSGGRKVSTYICNASGEKINDLIMRYNVGPTGTLLGSLSDPSYITKPGDCLVIEGENHVSYLMGYRMFVKKNTPKPSGVTATGVGAQFKKWLGTAIGSGTAPQAVSAPAPAAPAAPNSTTSASAFDLAPTGQEAGGTQGGQWYVDKSTGTKYFAKTYEQAGPQANDRRASEFIANSFYRLMGVPAPQSHLFKGMILSQEIPKGKSHYFSGPTKQSQANTTFGSHPDILT